MRRPCPDAPARPHGYGRSGAASAPAGPVCNNRGAAMIDPSRTVADLVLEQPSRARVFEGLGVDYCCGGKQSLSAACDAHGLAVDDAVASLESAAGVPSAERDWA